MKYTLKDKFRYLIEYFEVNNPEAASELQYTNAFQLLVAVVLSAQCTDKRVNMITPGLFALYPTPEKLALASPEEIYQVIHSVSYPNNKAKHLHGLAQKLVSDFGGEVPQTREELMTLSGVGRKSANVILSVCYDQPAMAVDTHVFRVSHRLGIVKNAETPFEVEKQLVKHIPEDRIAVAHHWLILHGRYVCLARKPKCEECGVREVCNYFVEKGE